MQRGYTCIYLCTSTHIHTYEHIPIHSQIRIYTRYYRECTHIKSHTYIQCLRNFPELHIVRVHKYNSQTEFRQGIWYLALYVIFQNHSTMPIWVTSLLFPEIRTPFYLGMRNTDITNVLRSPLPCNTMVTYKYRFLCSWNMQNKHNSLHVIGQK